MIAGGGALGVFVWVLAKIGQALIKIAEALAAAAAVFLVLWLVIKALLWALRQTLTHWRTSLTVVGTLAWWHWWGWVSLATTAGVLTGVLAGWRLADLRSFDAWAGRHLRAWWLRWTVYSKLPGWLHACGLGIKQDTAPVVLALTPLGRTMGRSRRPAPAQLPRVLGVRSGASWDLVRVRLLPGQNRRTSMRPPGRWPARGGWRVARSGNCPRTWCRSISSAATCSPTRWSAPIWPR